MLRRQPQRLLKLSLLSHQLGDRRLGGSARGVKLRLELLGFAGQSRGTLRQLELPLAGELQLARARVELFARSSARDAPALELHAQSRHLVLPHPMLILCLSEPRLRILQQIRDLLAARPLEANGVLSG